MGIPVPYAMPKPRRLTILVLSVGRYDIEEFNDMRGSDYDLRGWNPNHGSHGRCLERLQASPTTRVLPIPSVSAAIGYLDRNPPPHGILVPDHGVTEPVARELLARLVAYVRDGGTLVLSLIFSRAIRVEVMDDFWRDTWGLPWRVAAFCWASSALNRNVLVRAGGTPLPSEYEQKAVFLSNVSLDDSLYRRTYECSPLLNGFEDLPGGETHTPTVFAGVGKGRLGYTGDVHMLPETQDVVLRMFGV